MTYFKLLGVFEVTSDANGALSAGRSATPRAPKVRGVLALLLLQANRVVHVETIIEELWGPNPPRSAVTIVQTYIYHLRKIFAAENLDPPGKPLLATRSPGYLLHAEPEQVDAEVFERLVQEGRDLKEKDRPRQAAAALSRALGMWTGPALADVPQGRLLQAHAVHLEELRINADMAMGKHRELIAELRSLTCAHPFHEWFHGQLITVLSRSGRRSEALQAYQSLRALLSEELGVDPSPALQQLQQHVLALGAPDRCPPLRAGRSKPLGLAS